ncbi:unnamed protein product [Pieris brassicae]|uniref:Mitochondrial carrier protein n=1 Tax=Pieris brassicae TaxID=7116 RepID=A0A9P0TW69_PIEBR|nr:unnamed protein product [Pieris brassicae]
MVGFTKNEDMTPHQKIIAGCISGIVTRFITQPLDVLKIRTQLERRKRRQRTLMETSRKIFFEEGMTAFWHGHNLGQKHTAILMRYMCWYLQRYVGNPTGGNKSSSDDRSRAV